MELHKIVHSPEELEPAECMAEVARREKEEDKKKKHEEEAKKQEERKEKMKKKGMPTEGLNNFRVQKKLTGCITVSLHPTIMG
ncbi:hypothetical protein EX30DRAFT_344466 [Ascodesmis nigricans]|uniref:Uncharacterized protein n=1 Tax=Ascodesmis nigricans TaxID=341454 RepID=A0A4V3SHP6_9PEZI|nr:hypothetical protein EX30DRAFT_344466 [Ascodesmis nigricans]